METYPTSNSLEAQMSAEIDETEESELEVPVSEIEEAIQDTNIMQTLIESGALNELVGKGFKPDHIAKVLAQMVAAETADLTPRVTEVSEDELSEVVKNAEQLAATSVEVVESNGDDAAGESENMPAQEKAEKSAQEIVREELLPLNELITKAETPENVRKNLLVGARDLLSSLKAKQNLTSELNKSWGDGSWENAYDKVEQAVTAEFERREELNLSDFTNLINLIDSYQNHALPAVNPSWSKERHLVTVSTCKRLVREAMSNVTKALTSPDIPAEKKRAIAQKFRKDILSESGDRDAFTSSMEAFNLELPIDIHTLKSMDENKTDPAVQEYWKKVENLMQAWVISIESNKDVKPNTTALSKRLGDGDVERLDTLVKDRVLPQDVESEA